MGDILDPNNSAFNMTLEQAACYARRYKVDKDNKPFDYNNLKSAIQDWRTYGFYNDRNGTCDQPMKTIDLNNAMVKAANDAAAAQFTIDNPMLDGQETGPISEVQKKARERQRIIDGMLTDAQMKALVKKTADEARAEQHRYNAANMLNDNPDATWLHSLAQEYDTQNPDAHAFMSTMYRNLFENNELLHNEKQVNKNNHSTGNQQIVYEDQRVQFLSQMNGVMLLIYFVLCIVFLGSIFRRIEAVDIWTILQSAGILIILIGYPFLIFIIEQLVYKAIFGQTSDQKTTVKTVG